MAQPAEPAVRDAVAAAHADLAAGRYRSALETLRRTAADHPASHAAQQACGAVLANLGLAAQAEPYLRAALALDPADPRTRFVLASVLLAQENWAEGWPLYEARHALPGARPKPGIAAPEWAGEPLAGKRLLVWPEQGFGDQLLFARFLPRLAAQGADLTVFASLPLAELLGAGLGRPVFAVRTTVRYPQPDYWTLMGSIPGRAGFGATSAPAAYLANPGPTTPAGARIGLMLRGEPNHPDDAHRSLPPDLAERLLAQPGAISLHPDDTGAADFTATAALISGLDLVISADTAVAHLAAAMGKPVWVLLARVGPDWRWGAGGEGTAWYPQARLIRQPRIGDWASVVETVIADLAHL
jgi:tetratricopeptide (TPR) repeat protein